jgi:hypothetical protein
MKRPTIYLAAQYPRRKEIAKYGNQIKAAGYDLTSSWLYIDDDAIDGNLNHLINKDPSIGRQMAVQDLRDIRRATILVLFTESPNTPGLSPRGGRHFESGVAYERGMRVIFVGPSSKHGPRENIFHCFDDVETYRSWSQALKVLQAELINRENRFVQYLKRAGLLNWNYAFKKKELQKQSQTF